MTRLQPWQIIAVFPGLKPKPIGRTHNRADADDMVRFLQRKVPTGAFYVVFDPTETIHSNSEHQY
ncbi:hypothetical protein [Egbenema bharatensis]|uniref:hypothetical protein n=1 Tax=Egbenema bharatensis TaxID=3463334 RepID=UPI003A8A7ABD